MAKHITKIERIEEDGKEFIRYTYENGAGAQYPILSDGQGRYIEVIEVEDRESGDGDSWEYSDVKNEKFTITAGEQKQVQKKFTIIEERKQILQRREANNHNFSCHIFLCGADFVYAQFSGEANFKNAQFIGEADFSSAEFSTNANFEGAQFVGDSDFTGAQFGGVGRFTNAKFLAKDKTAKFTAAQFGDTARFDDSCFCGGANFWHVTFNREATFVDSEIHGKAVFDEAQFSGPVKFIRTQLGNRVTFITAQFSEAARFIGIIDISGNTALKIENSIFEKLLVLSRYFGSDKHQQPASGSKKPQPVSKLKISLKGCQINNLSCEDLELQCDNRETFVALKNVAIQQNDHVSALGFHIKEMETHYENLSFKEHPTDTIILWVEKWVSYFGTEPFLVILWLAAWNLGFWAGYCFEGVSWDDLPKSLLVITALSGSGVFVERFLLSMLAILQCCVNIFLIYELQKSFRKFSRKL